MRKERYRDQSVCLMVRERERERERDSVCDMMKEKECEDVKFRKRYLPRYCA